LVRPQKCGVKEESRRTQNVPHLKSGKEIVTRPTPKEGKGDTKFPGFPLGKTRGKVLKVKGKKKPWCFWKGFRGNGSQSRPPP